MPSTESCSQPVAADAAVGFGAIRLTLSTASTNHAAQSLYEQAGWLPDQRFIVYNLQLAP